MAAPKKPVSGKKPAKGGQKAVVKPFVKPTAATAKGKQAVGVKKPGAVPPKTKGMIPPKGKGGSYK